MNDDLTVLPFVCSKSKEVVGIHFFFTHKFLCSVCRLVTNGAKWHQFVMWALQLLRSGLFIVAQLLRDLLRDQSWDLLVSRPVYGEFSLFPLAHPSSAILSDESCYCADAPLLICLMSMSGCQLLFGNHCTSLHHTRLFCILQNISRSASMSFIQTRAYATCSFRTLLLAVDLVN